MHRHVPGILGAFLVLVIATQAHLTSPVEEPSSAEALPIAHDSIDCGRCHKLLASIGDTPSQYDISRECRACHQQGGSAENPALALNFHANPNRDCRDCHTFHEPTTIEAGGRVLEFDFDRQPLRAQCVTCHRSGTVTTDLSPGHVIAAQFYHKGKDYLEKLSPSEACLICHATGSGTITVNNEVLKIPRFNSHASHPYGIRAKYLGPLKASLGDSALAVTAPLLNGRIECQTCHNLMSDRNDYLPDFANPNELCLACHNK